MKRVKMLTHVLPWEAEHTVAFLKYLSDNYHPIPSVELYLDITVNLSNFHTDWETSEIKPEEVLTNIYTHTKNLKFKRVYLSVVSTDDFNGHLDIHHNLYSSYYDGFIFFCTDVDCNPRFLDIMVKAIDVTSNQYTWICPVPYNYCNAPVDMEAGTMNVGRIVPGTVFMGYFWFDYLNRNLLDFVGFPPFEGYGPQDSYNGWILSEIYKRFPNLDLGMYHIMPPEDAYKPILNVVEKINPLHKAKFTVKQKKEDQRAIIEKNMAEMINRRVEELTEELRKNEV